MKQLDSADRRALLLQLESMKRQVLDELRATAPSARAALVERNHEVKSHADEAEAERAADVYMAEVDRGRLEEIKHSIARLTSGRYGICEDCDSEIPRARLLAQPTATRCTACQATAEARRSH
ncbi:TraR/DksA family transcriptional regulator [Variovorax sp. 38R]|uniref:TraR/DksA family transcriptional regulator n=1 Tax=Variovorax sp. 38R TaxID=2774875 RepID=UPI001787408C|nr:TraR/DksA C4-type zinc finger protein [Variovorax sp. 38R]QOF76119.1 TraR/DksA C4-type zinc finger protein [Variovorax sp. 38R]